MVIECFMIQSNGLGEPVGNYMSVGVFLVSPASRRYIILMHLRAYLRWYT